MAVAEFLGGGAYEQHLRRIRREYARNLELMSDAVMRYFPEETRLTRPSGGFILWVQLPENVDSLELYKLALQGGITLAPGHVFSVFFSDATPSLGTLCGSACGSSYALRFSNNRSFCHSPSEAACLPTGAAPGQRVHPWFSWLGKDTHND
jgi:hypothetical protein